MRYSTEQLFNRRWGIYVDDRLLATVGCHQTCLKMLKLLEQKHEQVQIDKLRCRLQLIKTVA